MTIYGFSYVFVVHSSKRYTGTFNNREKLIHHESSHKILQSPPHSYRRVTQTPLASTTTKGINIPSTQQGYNVLCQKALRAPNSSLHTFLLDLLSYLQCVFQIYTDLPMPYEIIVPEDDDEYNPLDNRAVLIIDSPLSLSNDPREACLEMEVIDISPVAMIPNYCNVDKGLAHCVASSI